MSSFVTRDLIVKVQTGALIMLLGDNCITRTHYETLSVPEDASDVEIRASYKAAILDCHPDKMAGKQSVVNMPHDMEERFGAVRDAWEILRNSVSRAAYDEKLKALRLDFVTADGIRLEEMMVNHCDETLEYLYQCRCGDVIAVSSAELSELGCTLEGTDCWKLRRGSSGPASVLLACGSCSTKICLMLNTGC